MLTMKNAYNSVLEAKSNLKHIDMSILTCAVAISKADKRFFRRNRKCVKYIPTKERLKKKTNGKPSRKHLTSNPNNSFVILSQVNLLTLTKYKIHDSIYSTKIDIIIFQNNFIIHYAFTNPKVLEWLFCKAANASSIMPKAAEEIYNTIKKQQSFSICWFHSQNILSIMEILFVTRRIH